MGSGDAVWGKRTGTVVACKQAEGLPAQLLRGWDVSEGVTDCRPWQVVKENRGLLVELRNVEERNMGLLQV
jgi:hypothetical protein